MENNTMPIGLASISEWFCLKAGKENFTIIPERDQAFLFGKAQWRQQIDERLKFAMVLREPVRLVWWGDFGIGKTQRLQYMRFLVQQEGLPFFPIAVTCRDLTTKSGFDALHYDLVNNIGFNLVRDMVADYRKKVEAGDAEALQFTELSGVADVANAIERIGDKNDQLARAAWKFLVGLKLEKAEVSLANVTKPQLDSSIEFAAVLRCLAWVVRAETKKQLLFLVDQMETLTNVTNRDFENSWVETLRAVLDVRELGVVCTIGAVRPELLPAIMNRPEILSRFKQDNYVRLTAYEQETARDFLIDLLREWIDAERRDEIVSADGLDQTPGYSATTFPFTEPAFESLCTYLTNDPRDAKPREILERINRVAVQACLNQVRLITREELLRQGINA
jgi:hypothetical protein